ncbi:hypothetical protein QOZ98_000362 [Planomicrobium stackebrandtii]|uniref:Uncharacterized protein n=1 Tax=Planomicrobium stackebrandtii TaxID=253160 RepID=A0ABU0GSJ2_9BACL|nr:hypothetical protein [Planomicrobium stackebrandtii]MDQ0427537.1 hypothetical protein [Planomicrobium stackebrandtii]
MKKLSGWIMVCFLLATMFCVLGQVIADFLSYYVFSIAPIHYLTGLTILGMIMYIATGILMFMLFKKKDFVSDNKEIYFMIVGITSLSASSWAFFVIVMRWDN